MGITVQNFNQNSDFVKNLIPDLADTLKNLGIGEGSGPSYQTTGIVQALANKLQYDLDASIATLTGDLSVTKGVTTGSDITINSGTSYNDIGSLNISNGRSKVESEVITGTANGDTQLRFYNRISGVLTEQLRLSHLSGVDILTNLDVTGGIIANDTCEFKRDGVNFSLNTNSDIVSPEFRWKINNVTKWKTQATHTSDDFEFVNSSGTTRFKITQAGLATLSGVYGNTTASASNVYIDSAGLLYRSTSSLKYKENVQEDIDGDLTYQLKPVSYKSKNSKDDKRYIGFIAEEVAEVENRLVEYDEKNEPDALHYSQFTALLTKTIQDQKTLIDDLRDRVFALENN